MFIRAKTRAYVFSLFRLEARKLAGDNVLQAQGARQQLRDFDIVVACAVLVARDAVPRPIACPVQFKENVAGVPASAERKREISASRQPLRDSASEKFRV